MDFYISKEILWFATPSLPQSNPIVFPRTSQVNIMSKLVWIISCSYETQTELSCLWIFVFNVFLLTFPHNTSQRSINFLRPNGMPLHLQCFLWIFSMKHFFPPSISKYLVWNKHQYHYILFYICPNVKAPWRQESNLTEFHIFVKLYIQFIRNPTIGSIC